jgi:hypothetical protein
MGTAQIQPLQDSIRTSRQFCDSGTLGMPFSKGLKIQPAKNPDTGIA